MNKPGGMLTLEALRGMVASGEVETVIGGFTDQTTPWYQTIFYSFLFLIIGNLPTGLPGLFLIWQSRKIKQKLDLPAAAAAPQAA